MTSSSPRTALVRLLLAAAAVATGHAAAQSRFPDSAVVAPPSDTRIAPSEGARVLSPGTGDGPPASDGRPPDRPPGGGGGGGGVGIQIDFGAILRALTQRTAPEVAELARDGPRLPERYSFSTLAFPAVLRGGWPVVMAYDVAPDALVDIEFAVADAAPQRYRLPAPPAFGPFRGRVLVTLTLPDAFGDSLRLGSVSVHVGGKGDGSQPVLRIFGLGAGPLAVGSVAIDEVVFEPAQLRLASGDQAFYGFHSKSDFTRAGVDIARLENAAAGPRLVRIHSRPVQQSVARNAWVGREPPLSWNGQDERGAGSRGSHLLYVRAWAPEPGDWVIAWSPRAVEVRP